MKSIFYYQTSIIEFLSFKGAIIIVGHLIKKIFHALDRSYKILIYVRSQVIKYLAHVSVCLLEKRHQKSQSDEYFSSNKRKARRTAILWNFSFEERIRHLVSRSPQIHFRMDRRNFVNRARAFLYRWLHRTLPFQEPLTRFVELRFELIEKVQFSANQRRSALRRSRYAPYMHIQKRWQLHAHTICVLGQVYTNMKYCYERT